VSRGRLTALLALTVSAALLSPASTSGDHLRINAEVSAEVTGLRSTDFWIVELRWRASCPAGEEGRTWFDGRLELVNVETGERIAVGAVTHTIPGRKNVSGRRETYVAGRARPQRLRPVLEINCYLVGPLHSNPEAQTEVSGVAVLIPAKLAATGGGGGGGVGGGDSGGGDPTAPRGPRGCKAALLGTNRPDRLTGDGAGEVIVGFGARDRLRGRGGHDCLIGGKGGDRLDGEEGNDRLTGGTGGDVLVDRRGFNAFDAGRGNDFVNARNGVREPVLCGRGRDRARVDRRDRVRSCERLSRSA
jgi:hypothetical protein